MLIILTVILSGANRRNTNIKILSPTHRRLCNLETGVLFSQEVEPKLISEFLHYLYVAEFPFILVCTVPMLSLISRVPWVPYCSVMSISVISQQFFSASKVDYIGTVFVADKSILAMLHHRDQMKKKLNRS
jgi:hypothetical protein